MAICTSSAKGHDSVLRYDPDDRCIRGDACCFRAGGLDAPRGLAFQGGYVYVTSVGATGRPRAGKDSVLRFDAATGCAGGTFRLPGDAVFIASGSGGLDNPSRFVFGPDGKAYVSSTATTHVFRDSKLRSPL